MADASIDFQLYRYTPSQAAAGLFVALFSITTLYHAYQIGKARAWYFTAFVLGGVCTLKSAHLHGLAPTEKLTLRTVQIIGYICRIIAHGNKESIPVYSIQAILILLAPPLYAASIYMVLGRLITFLGAEHLSVVSVRWMTKIFVTGDVIAFLCQAAGLYIRNTYTQEKLLTRMRSP